MFLLFIEVFLLFVSVLNQLHPISIYIVSVLSRTEKGHGIFQGFPTVPSLFFRPTLAHFIGIFCIMPLSHHILAKHC
jgi:hypothetical protein